MTVLSRNRARNCAPFVHAASTMKSLTCDGPIHWHSDAFERPAVRNGVLFAILAGGSADRANRRDRSWRHREHERGSLSSDSQGEKISESG